MVLLYLTRMDGRHKFVDPPLYRLGLANECELNDTWVIYASIRDRNDGYECLDNLTKSFNEYFNYEPTKNGYHVIEADAVTLFRLVCSKYENNDNENFCSSTSVGVSCCSESTTDSDEYDSDDYDSDEYDSEDTEIEPITCNNTSCCADTNRNTTKVFSTATTNTVVCERTPSSNDESSQAQLMNSLIQENMQLKKENAELTSTLDSVFSQLLKRKIKE